LLLQKKVTKEKETGKDNFRLFWQNSSGLTLPKKSEVRTFSGLPTLRYKLEIEIKDGLLALAHNNMKKDT